MCSLFCEPCSEERAILLADEESHAVCHTFSTTLVKLLRHKKSCLESFGSPGVCLFFLQLCCDSGAAFFTVHAAWQKINSTKSLKTGKPNKPRSNENFAFKFSSGNVNQAHLCQQLVRSAC